MPLSLPSFLRTFVLTSAFAVSSILAQGASAPGASPAGAAAPAEPKPAASAEAKPSPEAAPAAQAAPVSAAPAAETAAKSDSAKPASPKAAKAPKAKAPIPSAANATAAAGVSSKASKSPSSIVITVGPNKIRRRQIDTLVDLMARVKKTPGELTPAEKQYLERMVATNLVGQELLDLEAKRLNVVADEKSIDSMSRVFKSNFPSEEAFRQALRQAGDTEAGLREKMIRQIKADKLLNAQVTPVSRPTQKEMQDFFAANKSAFPVNDSLRACQILLMVDKNANSAEIMKRKSDLEGIRADLSKDTAEIDALLTRFVLKAREVSDGPEKKDGGDLQRFLPGDFSPEFKKQVSALKVGQMSPVFRSPLGWHLVLLTEKNDGKLESYKIQVMRALVAEKSMKAGKGLKTYLKTLADRYKVSYLEPGYKDSSLAGVYQR
jgi:parvulin-like peptidyl-prolyl isomerase